MIWQVLAAAVGIWLMAAPAVLGYAGTPADDVDRILGPLAASIGLIAVTEATRGFRRANYLVALALGVLPWVLGYPTLAIVNSLASALALAVLASLNGRVEGRFGGGWRALVE
ncbi:MAG TPA: hypothetical protein VHK28_00860 [Candidatus Limnocylindria bacterium]|nr:hypothetical protein [Candidatus Limnocylindria bacterium]